MKKTIAVLLTLICLLTCTGVCAETAVSADELIPEVLAEVYGEPAVFSVSVVGDMFATEVPKGSVSYVISESEFICEYYGNDEVAHAWTYEGTDPMECMEQVLAVAESLYEYYNAFILVFVTDDNAEIVMLTPVLGDVLLSEGIYNDYEAFCGAAMELYAKVYPDA